MTMMLHTIIVVLVVLYKAVDADILIPSTICRPPKPEDADYFGDLEQDDKDIRAKIDAGLNRGSTRRIESDKAVNEFMFEANSVFVSTVGMCKYRYRTYAPPKQVWYKGQMCYVLHQFWYQIWRHVDCPKQRCSNVPCNQWSPYVYRCVPSCKRTFYMWIACRGDDGNYRYTRIQKKLPQCCECKRYKC
ncbi:uncharacterized protein LOC127701096 [Mytilus californianus]|uniref:uncharacterized protein LOC127701096 n=1 Tax=Mytilus californianus TaxID=6549 RepID=UPI002246F3AB|nr:uncharacterized protein LOC127701096 [Mytilus californianus]